MVGSLKSVFIREQKRYTKTQLSELFGLSKTELTNLINKLKSYGVLKTVANNKLQTEKTELSEDDIEITDVDYGSKYLYVFTFVGIISFCGIVLKCYPKYIFQQETPVQELKKILKVIDKFNKKEQTLNFQYENLEGQTFNKLEVILYLLNDYYEFGIYNSSQKILEINGLGEINWDKTINETLALISNDRPCYLEPITRKSIKDEFSFFRRLHKTILTLCTKELRSSGLIEIFDILGVELSDEKLDDFGDIDYILDKIQKELNIQFNTRKQILLKTMYSYIANEGGIDGISEFNFYGTKSFHVIWEKVCAKILDNHLEKPIGGLSLPILLSDKYSSLSNISLKKIIEKPLWSIKSLEYLANKTLIPDSITIQKDKNGEFQFLIFDAKYYNIQFYKDKIEGYPGVESITKQYLYQLAYKEFLENHKLKIVKNCFLFPTEKEGIYNIGRVNMKMLNDLGLEDIQLRLLSANLAYDYFLQNKRIDISRFKLSEDIEREKN